MVRSTLEGSVFFSDSKIRKFDNIEIGETFSDFLKAFVKNLLGFGALSFGEVANPERGQGVASLLSFGRQCGDKCFRGLIRSLEAVVDRR